jgi:hypothetical protein
MNFNKNVKKTILIDVQNRTAPNKIYTSMQIFVLVLKIRGMAYTAKSQILLVLIKKLQAKSAILLFAGATFFVHVFCTGVYTDVVCHKLKMEVMRPKFTTKEIGKGCC